METQPDPLLSARQAGADRGVRRRSGETS